MNAKKHLIKPATEKCKSIFVKDLLHHAKETVKSDCFQGVSNQIIGRKK